MDICLRANAFEYDISRGDRANHFRKKYYCFLYTSHAIRHDREIKSGHGGGGGRN